MAEPVLALRDVTKRFDRGRVLALDGVDLDVSHGELLAVVGPSGCGKSTMLRAVAGLVPIDSGVVCIAGRQVAGRQFVPPERRDVGVVFQDLALFPHLDVAANVAFGIGRGGVSAAGRQDRAAEVLALVGLGDLTGRYPHELSGGEQQRVALARALAPGPALVVLDEPFSHLDRNLRTTVREHTVQVLRAAGATGVLVTHDQEEALAVGDRVAVMRAGVLEQVGEPQHVFHQPANRFVATFLGEADFLPGQRHGLDAVTVLGRLPVTESGTGACTVMLRPHEVAFEPQASGGALVTRTEFRGASVLHHLALDGGAVLRGLRPHADPVSAGTRVTVRAVIDHPLAVFPAPPR